MDELYQRQWVLYHVRQLTPAGRRLLRVFLSRPGEWLNRNEIAALIGKRYLMRHDRMLLERLVEADFVIKQRFRLEDIYGKPKDYNGRNIAFAARFYQYQLDSAYEGYLYDLFSKRQKPKKVQPERPTAVMNQSPLDWLREKIGF